MFSYTKILTQAWAITTTRKFLWWFGLGVASTLALDVYTVVTNPDLSSSFPALSQFGPDVFFSFRHAPLVFVALLVVWIVVYFRSKAAMIMSVRDILENKPIYPGKTFSGSQEFLAPLLGISVITQLGLGLVSTLIFSPVIYLIAEQATVSSIVLGIGAGLLFLAFLFSITMAGIFSSMFVVALRMNLVGALKAATDLVGALWGQMLFMGLLAFGVWLLGLLVASIAATPFVIFSAMSYHTGGLEWLSVVSWVAGILAFLTVSAISATMYHSTWVVYFTEVVRTPKSEEEAEIPEAEVVS